MRKDIVVNLAKRMHVRHALSLPVDVEALANKYADLRFEEFPVDIDGVAANLKQLNKRPTILVNKNRVATRQRFTIAHEIGHVIIPWHMGTICDVTIEKAADGAQDYWEMEAEANSFATELLMPSAWVLEQIGNNTDLASVNKLVAKECKVSPIAATLRLRSLLSPGYIFIVVGADGVINYSGRSDETCASPPGKGSSRDVLSRLESVSASYSVVIGGSEYVWFRISNEVALERDGRGDWRQILDEMVKDCTQDPDLQMRYKQKINGVLGYANSIMRKGTYTEATLYSACLQRFYNNETLDAIIKHGRFKDFLASKIKELISSKA